MECVLCKCNLSKPINFNLIKTQTFGRELLLLGIEFDLIAIFVAPVQEMSWHIDGLGIPFQSLPQDFIRPASHIDWNFAFARASMSFRFVSLVGRTIFCHNSLMLASLPLMLYSCWINEMVTKSRKHTLEITWCFDYFLSTILSVCLILFYVSLDVELFRFENARIDDNLLNISVRCLFLPQ